MTPHVYSQETWLVTGATRGIGLAVTALHLQRGGTVIASYRAEPSVALQRLYGQFPNRLKLLAWDLRNVPAPQAIQSVVDRPIDVLFGNGAIFGPRNPSFRSADYQAILDAVDVNALGIVRMADVFLPYLRNAPRPRIVAVSSLLGTTHRSGSGSLGYRLSKAALNIAMQTIAAELAPENITCACLCPGWVRTAMGGTNGELSPEESAHLLITNTDTLQTSSEPVFLAPNNTRLSW